MTRRRSSAPVQTDPIRKRLGKAGVARDVTCPNCGVVYASARRWQMRCPECRHRWTDRSGRTLIDSVRDAGGDAFTMLFLVTAVLVALGFFVGSAVWLFAEASEVWGWERTYGLAAFFAACFVSILLIGKLRH